MLREAATIVAHGSLTVSLNSEVQKVSSKLRYGRRRSFSKACYRRLREHESLPGVEWMFLHHPSFWLG